MRLLRGSVVFVVAVGYLAFVFRLGSGVFWRAGLGDWMDPYFINYLLEHWYRSVLTLWPPESPPMFYPAPRTLGYSHGLILYAPIYAVLRPLLHPFQAYNLTLFIVVLAGTLFLYALLRRFLKVSFTHALLLTALFVTSANITNGLLGVWSQRASVFLIPPLIWLALVSMEQGQGRRRTLLAFVAGLLSLLLYVQDFYTAHLAAFFVLVSLPAARALPITRGWLAAFAAGAAIGIAVFLRIYMRGYREHSGFPDDQIVAQLIPWGERAPYDSLMPFVLVSVFAGVAWWKRHKIDRVTQLACLWAIAVSALVLLVAYRFGDFSVWRLVIALLPGYGAIRDPKRIIYLYELAVVLAAGVFLFRTRPDFITRGLVSLFLVVLIAAGWRETRLDYLRPNDTYARWIEQPIDVDPSCRSFFIRPASPEYASRPGSTWSVYHLDAMWIALRESLPTLNGYSAWNPPGWGIGNPHDGGYADAVRDWATRHHLQGVCALDIDARTMRPAY